MNKVAEHKNVKRRGFVSRIAVEVKKATQNHRFFNDRRASHKFKIDGTQIAVKAVKIAKLERFFLRKFSQTFVAVMDMLVHSMVS